MVVTRPLQSPRAFDTRTGRFLPSHDATSSSDDRAVAGAEVVSASRPARWERGRLVRHGTPRAGDPGYRDRRSGLPADGGVLRPVHPRSSPADFCRGRERGLAGAAPFRILVPDVERVGSGERSVRRGAGNRRHGPHLRDRPGGRYTARAGRRDLSLGVLAVVATAALVLSRGPAGRRPERRLRCLGHVLLLAAAPNQRDAVSQRHAPSRRDAILLRPDLRSERPRGGADPPPYL